MLIHSRKLDDRANRDRRNLIVLSIMYFSFDLVYVDSQYISNETISILSRIILMFSTIYFIVEYIFQHSFKENIKFQIYLPRNNSGKILLFNWFLFSLSILLSQIYNNELPTTALGYLLYINIIYFMIIPKVFKNPELNIIKASFYSSFIYLLLSIIIEPNIFVLAYRGFFSNPNSLGMIALLASISSFGILITHKNTKKISNLFYYSSFIISIMLILLSRSRTAFLAVIIIVFFLLVLQLLKKEIKLKHLIIPGVLFIYIYFTFLEDFFVQGILSKFEVTANTSDLLSGRKLIWETILTEMTFWGHGSEYFVNRFGGLSAHNGFLQFVGTFGIISSSLMFLFVTLTMFYAYKYSQKKKRNTSIIPLLLILAFFIINLSESTIALISTTLTMAFYNIAGVIIFEKDM